MLKISCLPIFLSLRCLPLTILSILLTSPALPCFRWGLWGVCFSALRPAVLRFWQNFRWIGHLKSGLVTQTNRKRYWEKFHFKTESSPKLLSIESDRWPHKGLRKKSITFQPRTKFHDQVAHGFFATLSFTTSCRSSRAVVDKERKHKVTFLWLWAAACMKISANVWGLGWERIQVEWVGRRWHRWERIPYCYYFLRIKFCEFLRFRKKNSQN